MKTKKLSIAKAIFAMCAGSILVLSLGCSADEQPEENITPTYSIGGTVTTSDGGGASGASVHLQKVADSSNLGQTATDAAGVYTFSGIPAGVYKIVVTFNGYETATIADFQLTGDVSGKDAVLQKFTVATYLISGTVTISDGGAAAGTTLQLQTAADNVLVGQSVTTDANGAYTLSDVPAGTYTLIATLDGYDAGVVTDITVNNANLTSQNIVLQASIISENAINIVYSNNDAIISNLPADGSVTATKSGADVTIASSATGEVEFYVTGSTSNGSLKIQNNATNPNTLRLTLNSAVITSTSKLPPIQITKNEGATIVELKGNSILSDNATNEENATLISKSGSLEFEGYGKLRISGAAKHAIASSKKNITVRGGDITVTSAASDGFHAEVGFLQSGGSLNITASGDGIDAGTGTAVINGGNINITSTAADVKGIKGDAGVSVNAGNITMHIAGAQSKGISSKADVAIAGGNITLETSGAAVLEPIGSGYDPSYCTAIKADGTITVSSGTITINSLKAANGGRGLSADGDITITGGEINIATAGDGAVYTNETGAKDSYSAACIKSDANISLLGGTITCNSSGTAGKGISADGTMTIGRAGASDDALTITASTTGAKFLVTGSTGGGGRPGGGGQDNSDYANPKIIKSTGNMIVNSGTLRLNGTTDGGEGLESKATLTINGGNIEIRTVDDCINAATHIQITGGNLYCKATGNDAIDSNGTITITGGSIIAQGAEEGLDCDNNTFIINGGTIIGVGSQSMGGGPSSTSTQGFVKVTATASTQLGIKNAAGEWILLYQVPTASSGGMGGPGGMGGGNSLIMLLSSPQFAKGTSYSFYSGGTITGGTTVNGYNVGGSYSGGTSQSFTVK
ncbi:carbohydrate-binding domain-containing protein [Candidatus Symbiothrix dinenymphae]|uniref:carbohydrate-binding domain-containing protein n=1 Tax=Candidatus Symbiothrix dinenymphae TaxID=467085 RepID=UPI0006C3BF30|nr:carbohydrate-binding domain-containing protein [Candidatus Symbiothrix dinenymphae]GAP71819.1 hypothetical protein SAMD00024442_19_23 [Candidatus Symbiothrix dinenymphae]